MNTRIDLLNHLCDRYPNPSYLEIGCRDDECFANVRATRKVGVDPDSGGTRRMTSDKYFAVLQRSFDVVFIDGLHLADQVRRDFVNSERHLNPGGVIVLHDCLPDDAWCAEPQRAVDLIAAGDDDLHGIGEWCGDVWRVLLEVNARPDIDVALWEGDHGCGIAVKRLANEVLVTCETFDHYKANYTDWIKVVDRKGLDEWLDTS